MKIISLYYVLMVERCGSLNKAAEKLYISQPNLSFAISSLEKELGYSIFIRTNQGVRLTEKGKVFLAYTKNILDSYEKMVNLSHDMEIIQYRLTTVGASILEEPFYTLCKEHQNQPNFQFALMHHTLPKILYEVYKGNYEMGIIAYSASQVAEINELLNKYHLVMKDLKVLVCNINLRQGHPALEGGFSVEKLWEYPFVDYNTNGYFSYHELAGANMINPARTFLIDEREVRCRMVSETNAYSIGFPLSKREQQRLGWVSIPFPRLQLNLAYVYKSGNTLDKISKRYLELLNIDLVQI